MNWAYKNQNSNREKVTWVAGRNVAQSSNHINENLYLKKNLYQLCHFSARDRN